MAGKKLDLSPLITHQFPLREYTRAVRVAMDRSRHRSIKVAMRPG